MAVWVPSYSNCGPGDTLGEIVSSCRPSNPNCLPGPFKLYSPSLFTERWKERAGAAEGTSCVSVIFLGSHWT